MRTAYAVAMLGTCLMCVMPAGAQRRHRDPLTPVQIDKIREAGIYPQERLKLYADYVNEHMEGIKQLTVRAHTPAWGSKMDGELQDLTALMDELGSNLDQYADRKADLRKELKSLTEDTQRWATTLRALPSAPAYDLSRKDAIASASDLADDAAESLKDQTEYFKEHKDQSGQQRVEPN